MKAALFRNIITTVYLAIGIVIFGQTSSDLKDGKRSNDSYFLTSVNFISDAVYMGRKDSISAPYLYPFVTYHHNSGFYATGSLSYLTKSNESRVDLLMLTAGYDFVSKKLSGDISATKYFFNDESYNVISEVEADITAQFTYDLDFLTIAVNAITYFNSGSNSDFFLSPEISHDFRSTNKKFQLSPTLGASFGSQNFYQEYYMNNRLGNRRSSGGSGQGSGNTAPLPENISIEESESFNFMALELSAPMWLTHKSFTITFMPVLVFPQNEATIIADETIIKEELDDAFYAMVGVSYRF